MPARRPFIAGNWKMFKTLSEARAVAEDIAGRVGGDGGPRVGIFPNAVALAAVAEAAGASVVVGAQDMHWKEEGAFTGAISSGMILSAGATAVLIGHSERRHVFGETDEESGKKVDRALEVGLEPVLCVGEKLQEREAGNTTAVVGRQLAAGIAGVTTADALAKVIIAYEPVWAIGTGKTASPAQGEEVHKFIRQELRSAFKARGGSGDEADAVSILCGGSVKPDNAGELLAEEDIDGFLVGGASLEAGSFAAICQAAG